MTELRLGEPRYYVPVCLRWPEGFAGGPIGYREVTEEDKQRGPIIVETRLTT